jgi:hypothetical protein
VLVISHPVVVLLSLVPVFIGVMSSLAVTRHVIYLVYADTALHVYAECGVTRFTVSVCCWDRYASQVSAWSHAVHNIMRLRIRDVFGIILS